MFKLYTDLTSVVSHPLTTIVQGSTHLPNDGRVAPEWMLLWEERETRREKKSILQYHIHRVWLLFQMIYLTNSMDFFFFFLREKAKEKITVFWQVNLSP